MMEMEVAVENNNMRNTRGRVSSFDFDGMNSSTGTGSQDSSKDRDYQYWPPQMCKVAMVGESAVGKTTICELFMKSNFSYGTNYYMTCGVEIYGKSIKIPEFTTSAPVASGIEERVNLIVVDSSGKDIYTEYLPKYWDKLDGVALVVDLTSPNRLENGLSWLELAKGSISPPVSTDKDKFLGILIGNKSDLTEQRTVSSEAARQFANAHHLEYFECSARQNLGLEEPFMYLAQQWLTRNLQSREIQGQGQGVGARTGSSKEDARRRKK